MYKLYVQNLSRLNCQHSSWADVKAGVPQGSILGPLLGSILVPLLFSIYINDLLNGLNSNAKLFADDVTVFCCSQCY